MRNNQQQSARPVDSGVKILKVTSDIFCSKTSVPEKEESKEESTLKNSSYFFKSMLNTMLNPISYKDRNGVYLGVNESFARQVLGLLEGEIIGHTLPEVCDKFVELFPNRSIVRGKQFKDVCREWEREETELLKSGGFKTHEQEVILANGAKGIFLVNRSTFKDENGEILGLVTVLQDITELKMSEKALEENEEKYRIVTEQTGQLVYDYDVGEDATDWTGNIEELTGYPLEKFRKLGMKFWVSYVHPDDQNKLQEASQRNLKYGGPYRLEYRYRKKDGSYIFIEDSGVCLKDENGNINRAVGVVKDITERKLAQERLEISEKKYSSFIHNFKGIAFQLDENLVPEFVHGAIEEITGYTEEDFMSTKVWWMDIVHPEDLPFALEKVSKVMSSSHAYDLEFEYRIKHKDGKIKWVHEVFQKVPGKGGKSDKYQGAVYDITEKKEAERALDEIKEARIKEIHHRIKNNLQVISSLLDLQAEKFEDKKVREAFRESQSRIISMALIHEELYQERNMETLNFTAYLRKLSENLFQTYRLDHPGIGLQMNLKEDIFLNVDTAIPLGIIINELVFNSLKHAFPGQKRGEIQIKLYKEEKKESKFYKGEDREFEGNRLVLSVSDNGVGVSESIDIEHPDTLGLQLVNALVDQLGGELELKRNNGTEFITRITVEENY